MGKERHIKYLVKHACMVPTVVMVVVVMVVMPQPVLGGDPLCQSPPGYFVTRNYCATPSYFCHQKLPGYTRVDRSLLVVEV